MNSKMAPDMNVSQLATAVMSWMSYISAVGRRFILSEGAIRFPVAEYLGQSNADGIELEYSHPKLFRKRFDLFFNVPPDKKLFFEFKYINKGSTRFATEKQRVFNDLMKLYLYLSDKQKGYFLICGSQFEFASSFQTFQISPPSGIGDYISPRKRTTPPTNITSQGFYTEWFSFDRNITEKEIDIKNSTKEYKEIYDTFLSEFKDPFKRKDGGNLKLPESLTTNLIFLSEDLKYESKLFHPSKVGVWEIIKKA
ncbi:MAG: hypothetical protein WBB02_03890 [Saprospiraceae bacterium]